MEIRYFAHSWLSDWNHGNAHFLRGLSSALVRRGHRLRLYEPMPEVLGGWSLQHLWNEPKGEGAIFNFRAAYPELEVRLYGPYAACPHPRVAALGLPWVRSWREELHGTDVVIAHEWNPPELFSWLVEERRRYGYRLLLHDTHHRAWSEAGMLERLPLAALDGVLAFGESLRRVYERLGRVRHTYTLHEAADLRRFHAVAAGPDAPLDVAWIGNWGDEERSAELMEYLLAPVAALRARARVYGVRYPESAQRSLAAAGVEYGGYLPNLEAPGVYAGAAVTVHIPRAAYRGALPGIPTIRMFEALACGVPLLSAPWTDTEALLEAGVDYWIAHNPQEMKNLLTQLLSSAEQRKHLRRHAAATIAARHTCERRAESLEGICHDLA